MVVSCANPWENPYVVTNVNFNEIQEINARTDTNLTDLPDDMGNLILKFSRNKLELKELVGYWCRTLEDWVQCENEVVFQIPRKSLFAQGKIQVVVRRSLDTKDERNRSLGVFRSYTKQAVEKELKYEQTWDDISEIRFCQLAWREDNTLNGSLELVRETTGGQQEILECPDWMRWFGEGGVQTAVKEVVSRLTTSLNLRSVAVDKTEFPGVLYRLVLH
jgi:hypothetical protein